MRKEIPTDICAARRSNLQIAQEFSALSDLFQRLHLVARLDLAGFAAAEAVTRPREAKELWQALDDPSRACLDRCALARMLPRT